MTKDGNPYGGLIGCDQCAAVAIDQCCDCGDFLCGDCRMFDDSHDETVCEACLTDREERDKRETE